MQSMKCGVALRGGFKPGDLVIGERAEGVAGDDHLVALDCALPCAFDLTVDDDHREEDTVVPGDDLLHMRRIKHVGAPGSRTTARA